jgi:5-methylcytosine-specific restriction enzyme subunit McrC
MKKQIIELDEYIPLQLHQELLPLHIGKFIRSRYGNKISVEFPSAGTDHHWKLISRGWVGFIPITSQITLRLGEHVTLFGRKISLLSWGKVLYARLSP